MSFPPIVYYINLAHRTDRKELFLQEMKKANIPDTILYRQEAVWIPYDGATGCTLSHLFALQTFLKSPHQVALICEDDFTWLEEPEIIQSFFTKLEGISFNIVLLAGNVRMEEPSQFPFLHRVYSASTTSAYLVHRKYAQTLYDNFKEGLQVRLTNYKDKDMLCSYAIDNHWRQLQMKHEWYIAHPKLGKQRADYSDIEKKEVDYNC